MKTEQPYIKSLFNQVENFMLKDGLNFILDTKKSHGSTLVNLLDGKQYINFHGGYRSNALGENYHGFTQDDYIRVARATINKQAHADIYTAEQLQATKTFFELYAKPAGFEKIFLIDTGTLSVENAIKIAIRNHALKLLQNDNHDNSFYLKNPIIIGLEGAFHGRSGLSMTLSRTDPNKHEYMPKFDWPCLARPKNATVAEVEKSLNQLTMLLNKHKQHIAAIILEPIQCEGGDHFLPKAFFQKLKKIADKHNFYLIYDETQTGFYTTGEAFAFQSLQLPKPNLICGAKKSSIGYVLADSIILDTPGNAFQISGKINSTWGGHGGDLLVCARKLELIHENNIMSNVQMQGKTLLSYIKKLSGKFSQIIHNPKGIGLLVSIDCPSLKIRDKIIEKSFANQLLLLPGGIPENGPFTIRIGPPLTITEKEIKTGIEYLEKSLEEVSQSNILD